MNYSNLLELKQHLLDGIPFRSKEVSWLTFNQRVLQEAEDPNVPPMERVRFLGIYSSNLDEFFRVRVATLKRLLKLGEHYKELHIPDPAKTLKEINEILVEDAVRFNAAYDSALKALAKESINVVDEESAPGELHDFLMDYFTNKVKPHLMPIMLKGSSDLSALRDYPMYLAVRMSKASGKGRAAHALIEIPDVLPRFIKLPEPKDKSRTVIYLDDVIRFGLPQLFKSLPYDKFESFAIKFTRDSELAYDDDFTESLYERISEGLRTRMLGNPVRINYDSSMPEAFLKLLRTKLHFSQADTLYPGARHHNRKDLMGFPDFGRDDLLYTPTKPLLHSKLASAKGGYNGLIRAIQARDILLHFPYQTFNHFLDLLREASLDPLVRTISITQYRFAKNSSVASAMISAAKNGKDVTVMVEATARFDEQANIYWAERYREAGVKVILGLPGLKVHAKICLITRSEGGKIKHYTAVGTGNFNESTAKLYTDHLLLTSDPHIGKDAERCFRFFRSPTLPPKLTKLICAPFTLRNKLHEWIHREIENAEKGVKAEIIIKINNLSDLTTIELLYKASSAGVKIRLIARSMFSLISDIEQSANIKTIGIVDKFLEHSRVFVFANGGNPETYISSADFLPRNFETRFEIVTPITDKKLQNEISEYLRIQWKDNVKARVLDQNLTNTYRRSKKKAKRVRAQEVIYETLERKSGRSSSKG